MKSILCWLNAGLNLLLKFFDILKLPVKLFFDLLRKSCCCLYCVSENTRKNTSSFKSHQARILGPYNLSSDSLALISKLSWEREAQLYSRYSCYSAQSSLPLQTGKQEWVGGSIPIWTVIFLDKFSDSSL